MGDRQRAIEFYNAGVAAANDRTQPVHIQHAYKMFSSAVFADGSYGEGWYALGNANNDLKVPHAAVAAWRRALQCDLPHDIRGKAIANIGWHLHNIGHIKEAHRLLSDLVKTHPDLDGAWINLGILQGAMGKTADAVASTRKAAALNPTEATNRFALGMALLYNQEYEEGFREFESRFEYRLHHFLKYPYPKWEGEPDKTVFVVADQGLGDTLSYARFIEEAAARAKYLHIVVQSELLRAFSQAFAHLRNVNLMPLASPILPADCWTTFVSLPYALKLTDAEVRNTPQITIPYWPMPTTWMAADAKLHVGIAWAGSPLNDINPFRNLPLELFLEFYRVPGVQLYGLQVGERVKDLEITGTTAIIRDLSQYMRDVSDTVAILKDLDLVITVESALGHICAAAGRECWIPYSLRGNDYRLGHRGEIMLWTPNHRVFQQDFDCRWEPVFEKITEALRRKVAARSTLAAE